MKTPAAKPALTVVTLALAWFIGAALPAAADTRTDLSRTAPSEEALSSVPRPYLGWYQSAARTCPGLGWPVLAGIGEVESDHGQSMLPGVHSAANFAGAEGPMQFEPRTFAAYAVRADSRHALSVYDPEDAIFTAARMLCDEGAASGTPQGIDTALYAYNHADWYPREVLSWAARYAGTTATVVFRRSLPVPAEHSHASHHRDHPQLAHHVYPVHLGHHAPVVAVTTRRRAEAPEAPSIGTEAQQLAAEAGQLAAEAHVLSGEVQQLTTEARHLSGRVPQPPAPQQQLPSPQHQPPSPAQQPASSTAAPEPPVTATPATAEPAAAAPAPVASPAVPPAQASPAPPVPAPAQPAVTAPETPATEAPTSAASTDGAA